MRLPFTTKVITGCESDGTTESPYLYRTTLLETSRGNLYLHKFVRSDRDVVHDHPWDFVSLILYPGYWEQVDGKLNLKKAGSLLFRPATWRHRVVLFSRPCRECKGTGGIVMFHEPCGYCCGRGSFERKCWSLVWVGQKKRTWGFWENKVFTPWREYFAKNGCKV